MSDISIIELRLNGFKGRNLTLALGGRDLVVAPNRTAKTSIVQAVEFLANGSISGVKREDLISFCSDDSFSVGITARREDGSLLSVDRAFKVTKSGGTRMALKFDPEGLEENLKEAEDRLLTEFNGSPLVTFDLRAFVDGDDSGRLETCMSFAPRVDGGVDEVNAAINDIGVAGGNDDERAAFRSVQSDLVSFSGPLPEDPLGRLGGLSTILDKWAKSTRAEVAQMTKSIRQISQLTAEAGVEGGANVESLTANLDEARRALRDLEAAAAKSQERRELIREERERMAERQRAELTAISNEEKAKGAVEDAEEALRLAVEEEEAFEAEEASWAEKDAARIERAKEEMRKHREALDEARLAVKAEKGRLADTEAALKTGRESLRRIERQADIMAQAVTVLELDATSTGEIHCPCCHTPLKDAERQAIIDQYKAESDGVDQAASMREAVEKLEGDAELYRRNIERAEAEQAAAQRKFDDAHKETYPQQYDASAKKRAEKKRATAEAYLERMHGELSRAEEAKMNAKAATRDSEERIGDLSVELPTDIEEAAIDGAKLQVAKIESQIRTVEANRHRFEDQERIRKELAEAEMRLKALDTWRGILGLKGITGSWLSKTLGAVLEPAQSLVRRVLKDTELGISWETPRGNPGLRVELRTGEKIIAYAAMSGAERAIVGTALILAFAGVKAPPALLAVECEVMDRATEEAYLTGLADLAGPSGLLVTTHHGDSDLGIYKRTTLNREVMA